MAMDRLVGEDGVKGDMFRLSRPVECICSQRQEG